ncbi:hypothetical protein PC117_g19285 [Phytophthora cactorum]|uniref:Reverse transcriptase domain-containing protein n=1 Tax=Phytophthora cactorum TaxID=29920 RepID=A0A8T1BVW2_9STRA|nr:hypothetical protein PC117_g19285 [Phytophthora cactorum]
MEKVFGGLEFVVVYLEYIPVFSRSKEEHLDYLSVASEWLDKYYVLLNSKKCHILPEGIQLQGK